MNIRKRSTTIQTGNVQTSSTVTTWSARSFSPEKVAVATMEIPWNLVKDRFPIKPEAVIFVQNMELDTLKTQEKSAPPVDVVVGLGGGSSTT